MRHRIRRSSGVGVTLFPFLAVLVCTMGALILLLIVIAHQARANVADHDPSSRPRVDEVDMRAQLELLELRIAQLTEQREKTRRDLSEGRYELGQIEDDARELRRELAQLEQQRAMLAADFSQDDPQQAQLQDELNRLRQSIAALGDRVEQQRQQLGSRPQSFAVVPYVGPNETLRRPIYIECTSDSIILQPEGVVLKESDFQGPLGPGNPLAAAVRAAREFLVRNRSSSVGEIGDPYPLLLVRPDGVGSYYVAREALKSWRSEFGYELIEADWTLDFKPPQPELTAAMQAAVDHARSRQEFLARTAPRRFQNNHSASFRVHGQSEYGSSSPGRGRFSPGGGRAGRRGSRQSGESGQSASNSENANELAQRARGDADSGEGSQPSEFSLPAEIGAPLGSSAPPGASRSSAEHTSGEGQGGSHRGNDWGLPQSTAGDIPIQRPIRVDCYADRLVLPSVTASGQARVVELTGSPNAAVDKFVSAVWDHMQQWGIAGRGMHWRPLLVLHSAPGGEARKEQLKSLLNGSGFDLRDADQDVRR